jgi:FkbM family methyltransferase
LAIPNWLRRLARRTPRLGALLADRDRLASQRDQLAARLAQVAQHRTMVLAERAAGTLLLDMRCPVDFHIHLNDDWEGDRIAAMMEATHIFAGDPRPKLFLDIGALWGLYALHAHRAGFFDRIVCFEPDPANAAQLSAQLFLNQATHAIEVDRRAVSDRNGPAFLDPSENQSGGNRGAARLVEQADTSVQVSSVRLDDVVHESGAIIFIKLDVEGHEAAALDGMQRLLASNDIYLQVEAFPANRDAVWDRLPPRLLHRWSRGVDHVFSTFPLPPGTYPSASPASPS